MDPGRLKDIALFAQLTDEQRAAVAAFATEDSVPAGRTLVREGDYSYELMAIEEGTASVTHDGEVLAELGPGDHFGEIGVLERGKRTATVTATSPMRIVTLTHWDVDRLAKRAPAAIEGLRRTLAERRPADAGDAGPG